jgi:hypothetical protein
VHAKFFGLHGLVTNGTGAIAVQRKSMPMAAHKGSMVAVNSMLMTYTCIIKIWIPTQVGNSGSSINYGADETLLFANGADHAFFSFLGTRC